jgi:hypothetical protein
LAPTSPKSGGRSVGIVRWRTKAPDFFVTVTGTRPRRSWVDNIKMDYKEGWDGMDSIDLAQDKAQWGALVNTVMNLQVP